MLHKKIIVTTEKDATRLHLHQEKIASWNIPILVIPIEINFLFAKRNLFDEKISQYVEAMLAEHNEIEN